LSKDKPTNETGATSPKLGGSKSGSNKKGKHRPSTLPSVAKTGEHAMWRAPSLLAVDDLVDIDTLVVMLTEDGRPLRGAAGHVDWRMCGHLSRLLLDEVASGKAGEHVLLPAGPNLPVERVLLFGCGRSADVRDGFASILEHLGTTLDGLKALAVAVVPPEPGHALQKPLESWAQDRADVLRLFSPVDKSA